MTNKAWYHRLPHFGGYKDKNRSENEYYTNRVIWGDKLRIFACIMVVGIHTAGSYYYYFQEKSIGWYVAIIIDSLGAFAVPSFLMLSGMLMLDAKRKVTYQTIIFHSIPKMMGLILYSYLSTWVMRFIRYGDHAFYSNAPTHTILWIILMYLFTPTLRETVSNREVLRNTIIMLIVLGTVVTQFKFIPHLCALSNMLYSSKEVLFSLLYYLLGYYLSTEKIRIKRPLCVFGIVFGYIINLYFMYVGLDKIDSITILGKIYVNSAVPISQIVMSCGMFCLFKGNESAAQDRKKIVCFSKSTMYIYMSHIAVRDVLMEFPFLVNSRYEFIKVPLYIFLNVIVSWALAILFMKTMLVIKKLWKVTFGCFTCD